MDDLRYMTVEELVAEVERLRGLVKFYEGLTVPEQVAIADEFNPSGSTYREQAR